MELIMDVAVGSFVAPGDENFRILGAGEVRALLERIDVDRLHARGIILDPFDPRPLAQRTRYQIPEAAEWPEGADPFDLAEMIESEGGLIPWSEDDQRAEAAFKANQRRDTLDASLDATDRFLAARSPFKVTVT